MRKFPSNESLREKLRFPLDSNGHFPPLPCPTSPPILSGPFRAVFVTEKRIAISNSKRKEPIGGKLAITTEGGGGGLITSGTSFLEENGR